VSEPGYCPKCDSAYEPVQEYCLECGERLPPSRGTVGMLAGAWQRRLPWYPGNWVWPAVLFLVVAAVATAVAAATTSKSETTIVATQPNVSLGTGTLAAATPAHAAAAATAPAAPKPTVTTGPLPKPPGEPPTSATPTPAPVAGLTAWPSTGTKYTDVLESLPVAGGRAAAVARARRAKAAGLPQAGILVSSTVPSLHPGYYVVFSGVYTTSAEAAARLATARSHGFPEAYVARVTHG